MLQSIQAHNIFSYISTCKLLQHYLQGTTWRIDLVKHNYYRLLMTWLWDSTSWLDFSKAFEKVSHQRLLLKLSHYGINGLLFNWIKDYLSNRQHQDGRVSSGSVLGPLLFLLYINDLTCEISSTIRLYADDVIIYRQIDTEEDVLKLQEDLAKLSQWAQNWLMHFNLSKCEHLTVTNKHAPSSSDYFLNNCPISKVSFTDCKYPLQVISAGINIVLLLLTKHILSVVFNLKQCSKAVKSKAYLAFVRPIMECASVIWSPYMNGAAKSSPFCF